MLLPPDEATKPLFRRTCLGLVQAAHCLGGPETPHEPAGALSDTWSVARPSFTYNACTNSTAVPGRTGWTMGHPRVFVGWQCVLVHPCSSVVGCSWPTHSTVPRLFIAS